LKKKGKEQKIAEEKFTLAETKKTFNLAPKHWDGQKGVNCI